MNGDLCTTCGKPKHAGYINIRSREACVDPCHAGYLLGLRRELFFSFHGKRKANALIRKTYKAAA